LLPLELSPASGENGKHRKSPNLAGRKTGPVKGRSEESVRSSGEYFNEGGVAR
jgi:hypothetical protein